MEERERERQRERERERERGIINKKDTDEKKRDSNRNTKENMQ